MRVNNYYLCILNSKKKRDTSHAQADHTDAYRNVDTYRNHKKFDNWVDRIMIFLVDIFNPFAAKKNDLLHSTCSKFP